MDEENKVCNKSNKISKNIDNNIETKEIRLEKMSPGFNLVSLKARHRLNKLEKIFSKSEYKDYIRKCKNMYSISSVMNNKYSISDLYVREKYDINDIVSIYNIIDSKLDSQKIKVTRMKKNNIKSGSMDKSLSCTNFYRNKSNFEKFKSNSKLNKRNNNNGISKNNNSSNNIIEECKNVSFNNNKNMNHTFYDASNNKSISNGVYLNNPMNKTSYEVKDNKNKILNYKNQISIKSNKNKEFSKTSYASFFSSSKNDKSANVDKNENENKIKRRKLNKTNSAIYRLQPKQFPLSCKNRGFTITQFGAIIYNHSMFRNKNIVNLLPKYYNLPLLYNNIKV